jgi:hypothetical protein
VGILRSSFTALTGLLLLGFCGTQAQAQALPSTVPPINLGVLAVISDGEQDALSYSSGKLAAPGRRDLMTLWTAPFDPSRGPAGSIEAPNSNFGPSGVVAVSRNGKQAFVVETMRRPVGAVKLNELVPSNRLLGYDISDPTRPRMTGEVVVGTRPLSLDLSGDGRTIVTLSKDSARPLAFSAVAASGLSEPVHFAIAGVREDFNDFGFVQWSPTADAIAINLPIENRVLFFRVDRSATGVVSAIRPWGNPVTTNKYPFVGRFTPDGRHYITSDVNWGPDVPGFFGTRRGILTLIRVADDSTNEARHLVVDGDIAGVSAESFAISPDGRYVVASNIETTGSPIGHPRHNALALLTLYRLDGERSQLSKVAEVRYAGLLPQGIAFDADGRHVLVGVNELVEDRRKGGVLVFRLERSPEPRLIDTGIRLEAAPGVHSIAVAGNARPVEHQRE